MRRLLIDRCPLSPVYRCSLVVDGNRYWSVLHYYFCEKYNWRGAFPNRDTERYYDLLRNCDTEEVLVMLGRKMPRLRRRFKTRVNSRKPELGYVDTALKWDVRKTPGWETGKHDAMLRALRVRLSKHEVGQALHKTHGAELIYRPKLILLRIPPSATWGYPGGNAYGRLLMELRRTIPCESDGLCVPIESKRPIVIDWNGVEHDGPRRLPPGDKRRPSTKHEAPTINAARRAVH